MALVIKNLPTNAGDTRGAHSIPGLGRSPGLGNGNLLQYSCLEHSINRGVLQAVVHGVAKNWMQLSTHTREILSLFGSVRIQRKSVKTDESPHPTTQAS